MRSSRRRVWSGEGGGEASVEVADFVVVMTCFVTGVKHETCRPFEAFGSGEGNVPIAELRFEDEREG